MDNSIIPFAIPDIGQREIEEVVSTLKTNWITTGPKVKQFESEFASFFGPEFFAVAVNSATAGLHLGLESLGVGPGDEVITTTHTFTATAEVVRYLGAHPVFVDIDPITLCIDPKKIKEKISKKTKVIIPVHFGGYPAEMNEIIDIAKKNNIKIMEDAAHSLPTTYNGKLIGSLNTDLTVFSFYANKTMTTGEGGMIVTKNRDLEKRIKVMRLHGINKDVFDRFNSNEASWYYEVIAPGYKYNMTDISASIGLIQLSRLKEMQKKRQSIAEAYNRMLVDLPIILPVTSDKDNIHSWHLYIIRLTKDANISRNDFIDKMKDKNIGCSVHYIPLHVHPYWKKKYNLNVNNYSISQASYESSISIPIYSKLEHSQVERIAKTIRMILDK